MQSMTKIRINPAGDMNNPLYFIRTHPKTCFVTRLSENSVVKAGGGKGSEVCFMHIENLFRRQRRTTGFAANRSRKRF